MHVFTLYKLVKFHFINHVLTFYPGISGQQHVSQQSFLPLLSKAADVSQGKETQWLFCKYIHTYLSMCVCIYIDRYGY